MFIELDLQSESPLYVQLRNEIIKGIATGKLNKGESLPSVRQFAEDLGINMHTVNKAYTILKQEGFILVHRKKGVVINPENLPDVNETYISTLKTQLKPLIIEAACRKLKKEEFNKICEEIYNNINGGSNSCK